MVILSKLNGRAETKVPVDAINFNVRPTLGNSRWTSLHRRHFSASYLPSLIDSQTPRARRTCRAGLPFCTHVSDACSGHAASAVDLVVCSTRTPFRHSDRSCAVMLGPLLLCEGVLHRRITGAVLCERQGSNAVALNSGTLDNRVVGIHLFFLAVCELGCHFSVQW